MKKRNFVVVLSLLLCVLAAEGCDKNESKYDLERVEKPEEESEEELHMERQTIGKIWDIWDAVLRKEYKNLEIPADLDIEMPEEIGVYRFVQADDVLDEKERIFNEFIPKKRRQEKYYKQGRKL